MKFNKINTKRLIISFLTGGADDNADLEIKRKAILMNTISLIGILNLVPLAIDVFTKDNIILGIFDLSVVGVLIILLLSFRKTGYHFFYNYIGCRGSICLSTCNRRSQ